MLHFFYGTTGICILGILKFISSIVWIHIYTGIQKFTCIKCYFSQVKPKFSRWLNLEYHKYNYHIILKGKRYRSQITYMYM